MTTVGDLVHKLGGPQAVALWCGSFITGDAVTAWSRRDQIPWKWRTKVKRMARARGVQLTDAEQEVISLDFKP